MTYLSFFAAAADYSLNAACVYWARHDLRNINSIVSNY